MNSKKWCIIALLASFLAFLSVPILNALVDPFGVFGDEWYSYNITNNPRVGKIEYLKKNHQKYDSYVIGCSSTSSYPVNELNKYLDAKFYNLIMYGGDMLDVEQTVYYVAENYEVKNLVVNVYISNGKDYDVEADKYTTSMHADVDGKSKLDFYFKYLFANPQYSFAKIRSKFNDRYLSEPFDVFDEETGCYDKRKRDAEHISDLDAYYNDYPIFKSYPQGYFNLSNYKQCAMSLSRIKKYCERKEINFIPVNGPVYYEYFKYVPVEDVRKYYNALAETSSFWDFSVSSVSLEPRFFYDETHFRNDIGKMMLARIFGDDSIYIPEDFGTYITKDNVSEYVDSLYGKTYSDSDYTQKLPILLYHNISYKADNNTVTPENFDEQVKALKDNGYNSVSIDDVISYIKKGRDLPENPVMITFDGGFPGNYEYAYPILKKYNIKASMFIPAQKIKDDTSSQYVTLEQILEMQDSGLIDIQSNSYSQYKSMLQESSESDEEYVYRITEDYKNWENFMGYKPKALAFPHGESDLFTQAVLNDNEIVLTFSENPKVDTLLKGIALSGYSLGRFTINSEHSANDILKLININ